MRIVAGKLRHRIIEMTNLESTRETQDKVRQAIFNMIGPYFSGGTCLDLFAGSGAMAIEAFSRGIESIYLNDINKDAIKVCQKNCLSLQIKSAFFSCLDYEAFCRQNTQHFDLIILDPPYKMNQISEIIELVYPFLLPNGLLVFEMGADSIFPNELKELVCIKNKSYGIKKVIIYQRKV